MRCLAAANTVVHFDRLPDEAIRELASPYGFSGERAALLAGLRDHLLRCTYPQLAPIFVHIQEVATRYGVPDAINSDDA